MSFDTILVVVGIITAILVLLFGDNIVQQATGSSVFEWLRRGNNKLYRVLVRKVSVSRPGLPEQSDKHLVFDLVEHLGVIDVFQPLLSRNLISAKLHKKISLKTDAYIDAAFEHLNQQRAADGKVKYYSKTRYRIIRSPQFSKNARQREYLLDLAEMDFQYFSLLHEKSVDVETKKYVRAKVDIVANSLSVQSQRVDQYLNPTNVGMLGVQMVLITSDGYTLLRRRGKHVMEYGDAWDVSFSGYCGDLVFESRQFDIGNTVEFELDQEIKILRGDPRNISFTGLHLSTVNRTTVMLGFWNVDATSSELKSFMDRKSKVDSPVDALVFDTTILPKEKFVWDYKNLIVEFDAFAIAKALQTAEDSLTHQPYTLVPAARASLLLALHALNKPTDGLMAF